jgi:hypothetical protein
MTTSSTKATKVKFKLAENGRQSIGKRSKHLNIKCFFVTDLINRKQISIKYCPTDGMLAVYMTKPLTGRKFQQHRSMFMNLPPNPRQSPQECVGDSSPSMIHLLFRKRNVGSRASLPGEQQTTRLPEEPGQDEKRK